ncbi:MAG: hypothetical protein WCE46_02510 [Methanoregula sp.]|uniref:hypothetical protein n=1 Tax=Methanoregula sp. TaxID=2052170 RepID=UPI003C77005E
MEQDARTKDDLVLVSQVECIDQPDCKLCPDFIRCTTEFQNDINRDLNNAVFGGYVTYHQEDFIGHEDFLPGLVPMQ